MKDEPLSRNILTKLIDRFKLKDINTTTIEDYQQSFSRMIKHLNFVQFYLPKGLKLHRVRPHQYPEEIKSLKDLWCPEPPKSIGRLNDLNDRILYTAHGADTAFRELSPESDTYCTFLEMEVKKEIKVIQIGVLDYIHNENSFFNSVRHKEFHDAALKNAYNRDKKLIALDREFKQFITQEFTKDSKSNNPNFYNISISMAKQFFLAKDIDAIMYPSVKSDKLNINVALKSEIAKTHLLPLRIDMFQIKDSNQKSFDSQILIPVKGCYDEICFNEKLKFSESRDVEGWAVKN